LEKLYVIFSIGFVEYRLRRIVVGDFVAVGSTYPINPQIKIGIGYMDSGNGNGTIGLGGDDFVLSASSFHPGGANFAFIDGSVRFIKDSDAISPESPMVLTQLLYGNALWQRCRKTANAQSVFPE
jgi:prepilin-type processing-associated H-X9-DG protein